MPSLIALRPAAASLLLASVVSLAACVSVPPAPIDPAATAKRLIERSLQDPKLAAALAKAGLSPSQQAGPNQAGWTLDALTVAAWTLRPDIAVAAADVAVGDAAERVAGELPNPTLSLDPGYLVKNANNNLSPWTIATALQFTIETADKAAIRSAQAHADTEVRKWQLAEALWRARQEVRKALLSRQISLTNLALAEHEVAMRKSYNAWVETELRFGAVAQPDRLTAQTNLAQAQGQLRTARGDLAAAEAELASAVGVVGENLPLTQVAPVATDTLPGPTAIDPGTLRDWGVINRLGVSHALADYAVTEQALRMAVAKQYPDIGFAPGYTYDKGDRGITLSLGVTLPLFHGERAAIDQAIAVRQKAATQFEAAQAQALAEIDTAIARYRAAYAALVEAKDAEATTSRAAAAAERRLTMGGADRGEVLTAQLARVVGQRATLDALRSALDALGALEDGVQRPIWPASTLALARPDAGSTE